MSVELGDKVQDIITGYTGIAICRHSYLQGCDRITIQPPMKEDGTIPDAQSFDEPELKVLERGVAKPVEKLSKYKKERAGGPARFMDNGRRGKDTGRRA